MPAIQVRDFSDEAYAQIKALAKENGRSITQQTKFIVLEYLAQHGRLKEEAARRVEMQGETPIIPLEPRATHEEKRVGETSASAGYPNPFRMEDPTAVAARVARRKALFERIASRQYSQDVMETDDAALVREMRDER